MNFIGEFREKEIDGKPFFIFTYSSLQDNLSSSSSGVTTLDSNRDNLLLQPLFLCPSSRLRDKKFKRMTDEDLIPFTTSPLFTSIRSVDQQVHNEHICKYSVSPLSWCNNKESKADFSDSRCDACGSNAITISYYFCVTCNSYFHKECVESPLHIKHPSYPFLSLQLCCPPLPFVENPGCIRCERAAYGLVYYCPTYKLTMHPICAMKPTAIVINHPKSHPHPLIFFPKHNFLPCNICGLINKLFPTYVCARCVFVVHEDCIYFPNVIRISRHSHRISFTSSFPSGEWFCGVCRRKIDNDYGAYSCNKCENYFVHSRCAIRRDLWDGVELEGVPEEEPEIVVEPFEKISDGIILHFSHGHHLKLHISIVYDQDKFCQACILPIYEGNYYSCVDQCDFILHERCANTPLKKHHGLHAHSLTLEVLTNGNCDNMGYFRCMACLGISSSFVYKSSKGGSSDFELDFRCALVEEPFEYQGHEHPLFLALTPEEEKLAKCEICKQVGYTSNYRRKLNCIECDYVVCFRCATLPYMAKYKHDIHFLTFREEEEASDHSDWCDICERKIVLSRKGGFYSCDDYCCTTLHIDCLLGEDMYMRPGHTMTYNGKKTDILLNNTMSRSFCHLCEQRCPYPVLFRAKDVTVCSLNCLRGL